MGLTVLEWSQLLVVVNASADFVAPLAIKTEISATLDQIVAEEAASTGLVSRQDLNSKVF